jgi:MFS family permease
MFLVFFREKPPKAPSRSSAEIRDHNFKENVVKLIKNKNLWVLGTIFSFGISILDSHATVSGEISVEFGFTTSNASMFGFSFILFGLIGAAVFGIYVDKTSKYKRVLFILYFAQVITVVLQAYCFTIGSVWLVALCSAVQGFFTVPVLPLCIDLGVEITYPIEESYSAALLMTIGSVMAIVFNVICSALLEHLKRQGALYCQLVFVLGAFLAFLTTFFVEEKLNRKKFDNMDNVSEANLTML